jgi:DnaJ-class molecular chaperone
MKITTKYSLGDSGWIVRGDSCEIKSPCRACDESGCINNDFNIKCPRCSGTGHGYEIKYRYYSIAVGPITGVNACYRGEGRKNAVANRRITYETAAGTHAESDIYQDKKSADEEVKRKNKNYDLYIADVNKRNNMYKRPCN